MNPPAEAVGHAEMNRRLYAFLDAHGIYYDRCDHPPASSCEQAERIIPDLPGRKNRNLFLRDAPGRRHFLVVTAADVRPDVRALGEPLGAKRPGFASPQRLARHLATPVGAVSVLSLLADTEAAVELVVDRHYWADAHFLAHPFVNTTTLVLAKASLEAFLAATGHSPTVLDVPRRQE